MEEPADREDSPAYEKDQDEKCCPLGHFDRKAAMLVLVHRCSLRELSEINEQGHVQRDSSCEADEKEEESDPARPPVHPGGVVAQEPPEGTEHVTFERNAGKNDPNHPRAYEVQHLTPDRKRLDF
mmetsp:Transcript_15135/g.29755  ORF Transcript_15135/g.29755 Transcript_15135/m.29755 type:complete len:125 (-) Transcript_15135:2323-2697(-)